MYHMVASFPVAQTYRKSTLFEFYTWPGNKAIHIIHMGMSHAELEQYSIVYSNCIAAFKVLYLRTFRACDTAV